ncbi:MAG: hypothetical protein RLZZ150_420 [Bacteroidota bacterium]|jgi:hypothetical protein
MPNELLAVGEGMSPLVMWGIVALVVLLALSIIKKLVKLGILVAILLVLIFVVRALMAQTI